MNNETLSRSAFLRSLGLSTSALMAFYCIGTTMTACGSKKEDDPDPGGSTGNGITGTTTGSNIQFTLDLKHNTFAKLKTAGESSIVGDVLIAHTTSGTYAALSKICTHEGTTLGFRSATNDLACPQHGSEFKLTGEVQKGPNTGGNIPALKVYKATLSADGNSLTVTS